MVRLTRTAILPLLLSLALVTSGCSTKWVNVAQADLPILVNLVSSVYALADPNADKDIQEYAAEASADLQLVATLVNDYNKAPTATKATTAAKVLATLNEVSSHLNAILTAAHIKNTAKAQHIAQAVQLGILTVTTITALIQNSKTTAQLPTPTQLQAAVNDLRSFQGK